MQISIHIKSGQNKWEVKAQDSNNIRELKEEIFKVSGVAVENQRLIHSGKILKDDQSIESYKILDGHSVHMVKAGVNKAGSNSVNSTEQKLSGRGSENNGPIPVNISTGQSGGFNPLADLTGARYAGYTNLPSTDIFGPDGGLNSAIGQEEVLNMLENPIFQSQMNEMLNNPQMVDFLIQQHPHLQAMGPAAREMLQSPFFRQMMTNPDVIRQMSRFQMDISGSGNNTSDFPAPGSVTTLQQQQEDDLGNASATPGVSNSTHNAANPFASFFNAQSNPLAAMFGGAGIGATPAQVQDNRPPEERYEQQLRQLNDMGFFDFDRNVAALRRSGGSVQGALDVLLNGDV